MNKEIKRGKYRGLSIAAFVKRGMVNSRSKWMTIAGIVKG